MLELAGVKDVDVHLATDEFTISYDANSVSPAAMQKAIAAIGYSAKVVESELRDAKNIANSGKLPALISDAITKAKSEHIPIFLDFTAVWCGACKILDRTTLSNDEIKRILGNFVFLKVDADQYPDVLAYFSVVGLPTLVALDSQGAETYRHIGPIDATALTQDLGKLLAKS